MKRDKNYNLTVRIDAKMNFVQKPKSKLRDTALYSKSNLYSGEKIMNDFIQNIYVYLWGVLAILMFAVAAKNRKTFGAMALVLALFFVFMTVWYGLRTFGGYEMFEGSLGIIFRVVMGVFLIFLIIAYLIYRKKSQN